MGIWIRIYKGIEVGFKREDKNIARSLRFTYEVAHMDADEGLVFAGAALGISMLAVWIVFVFVLLWTRGPG